MMEEEAKKQASTSVAASPLERRPVSGGVAAPALDWDKPAPPGSTPRMHLDLTGGGGAGPPLNRRRADLVFFQPHSLAGPIGRAVREIAPQLMHTINAKRPLAKK